MDTRNLQRDVAPAVWDEQRNADSFATMCWIGVAAAVAITTVAVLLDQYEVGILVAAVLWGCYECYGDADFNRAPDWACRGLSCNSAMCSSAYCFSGCGPPSPC